MMGRVDQFLDTLINYDKGGSYRENLLASPKLSSDFFSSLTLFRLLALI